MWIEYNSPEQLKILKMYTLFEAHYDKGYTFHGETHDFWECMFVKSGSVCVSGNERVYNLHAGEIIFHKPLELHKFSVNSDNGCDILTISFELSGNRAGYFKNMVFKLTDEQNQITQAFLGYLHSDYFNSSKANDAAYFLKRAAENPVKLQMIMLYFTQLLLSLCCEHTSLPTLDSLDSEIFQMAVKFMKENISSPLSVRDIAVHCQVSQTVLKNIFTKYSGMGVHKYFLTLKISSAARALKKGMSVTTAAYTYGFKSQSYFSAAFKRETGIAPKEYAKINF